MTSLCVLKGHITKKKKRNNEKTLCTHVDCFSLICEHFYRVVSFSSVKQLVNTDCALTFGNATEVKVQQI